MFGDQHLESLGGAQVSMRLQRRFLEKAGHTVTIVAPRMHGPRRGRGGRGRMRRTSTCRRCPITLDREYAMTWPGRRTDRPGCRDGGPPAGRCRARAGRLLGRLHRAPLRRAARAAGRPHDAQPRRCRHRGDRAVPGARAAGAQRVAAQGARRPEPKPRGRDGWAYLRRFAERSDAVTAPSSHFARRLEAHGVVPARRAAARRRHLERHRRRPARRGARRRGPSARPGRRDSCGSGG